MLNMKKYVVFLCANCGLPQYARNDRKSRECPKCSFINSIDFRKIRGLLQTDDVKEAFEAVALAKMNKNQFKQLPFHTARQTQFLRGKTRVMVHRLDKLFQVMTDKKLFEKTPSEKNNRETERSYKSKI
jgi:hypothetical protein